MERPRWGTHNVSAVLIRHSRNAQGRRRGLVTRAIAAALAALALAGMIVAAPTQAAPAQAETESDVTVKWLDDSSAAKDFQPDRLPSSPHYNEFKDVQISVSQTTGIIDQAVRVSVTGFAGTRSSVDFGTNAQNYLQAMQCWGPDPLADNFRETCQWGGRVGPSNGLGNSVYPDNVLRVSSINGDPFNPTTTGDVPFRTAGGTTITGKPRLVNGQPTFDLLSIFGPSTTNEVTSARVSAAGTGYFDFETQTADQAPQLGCGSPSHLRCWLVVVPRGTVFGGNGVECSGMLDSRNNYEPYAYGRRNSYQGGSPISTGCDYWDNRITIPLDFTPLGTTCEIGSTEQRVVGSQLMVGAMSSWQPALCNTLNTTFSFSTNPDAIAREQVLETSTNSPGLGYVGFPLSSGELSTQDERDLLAKTKLTYAPVAVSAVVLAFVAEFDGGREESLVLSPRLMAKFLTQSYKFTVPWNTTDPSKNFAHLPAVNQSYSYLYQDPDFQELNPTNYYKFTTNPAIVLPGPSGADAIRQVWRWILADSDAVAFLDGTADPWGMEVNPYYRALGDPKAVVPWWLDANLEYVATPTERKVGLTKIDGTPEKLSSAVLDIFPRNDESLVPLNRTVERTRFDSLQYAPYAENLILAARQAFRAEPNSKTVWDSTKLSQAGDQGDWISSGAQVPGQKFMIAVTDSPSALRYSLSTAALTLANTDTAVEATPDAMAAALSALEPTSVDVVKQINPPKVPETGYPLTVVTYAAVNLSKSTVTSRLNISGMLMQITTAGQVQGSGTGQLPAGYIPLTEDLAAQAAASAREVAAFIPPVVAASTTNNATNGIAQDDYTMDSPVALEAGTDPTMTSGVDDINAQRTAVTSANPFANSFLVIALVIGLAGLLIAPRLFRGRGVR